MPALLIGSPIGLMFQRESIRAIRDERKTMTRRIVGKDSPIIEGRIVPGRVLYAREAYISIPAGDGRPEPIYAADYIDDDTAMRELGAPNRVVWTTPYLFPARFARVFAVVESTRTERLSCITDEDALKEGVAPGDERPRDVFLRRWDVIHKGHPNRHVASDPAVRVIDFAPIRVGDGSAASDFVHKFLYEAWQRWREDRERARRRAWKRDERKVRRAAR